jgi:hypothetical protein
VEVVNVSLVKGTTCKLGIIVEGMLCKQLAQILE